MQEKVLEQLTAQERLLSQLYSLFSGQFQQYEDFWKGISKDEERHAAVLEKLHDAAEKGAVLFDEGKLNPSALNTYITRLESLLQRAKDGKFNISSALASAVDYESSIIESKMFTRFEPINSKAKNALQTLHAETESHVARIKDLQKSLK